VVKGATADKLSWRWWTEHGSEATHGQRLPLDPIPDLTRARWFAPSLSADDLVLQAREGRHGGRREPVGRLIVDDARPDLTFLVRKVVRGTLSSNCFDGGWGRVTAIAAAATRPRDFIFRNPNYYDLAKEKGAAVIAFDVSNILMPSGPWVTKSIDQT
jgi:hypothetical protein